MAIKILPYPRSWETRKKKAIYWVLAILLAVVLGSIITFNLREAAEPLSPEDFSKSRF